MTGKPTYRCGKHGCESQAVARVFVTSPLMEGAYVACPEHISKFAEDLREMLELPSSGEWSIRIYGLVYSNAVM